MNKPTFQFIRLVIMFALMFAWYVNDASAASNTYYVSPTGNDSNPGTNGTPFKTFAKANSVLQAGDTLQVLAGTYDETLTLSKSGIENDPIKVIGNSAVLNMQGVKQNGITITGDYIHVSGFEVVGAKDFGILVGGDNILVENNTLHDNVTKNGVGTCGTSASWGSGLKVRDGSESILIRGNIVYDNCGEGIAVTRGVSVLVENNTVYDNFSVNIYVDNSPFVTVQSNTSYCTGTHLRDGRRPTGIALGEETYLGWGAQLHDILITNNTITDCYTGVAAYKSNVGGTLTNVSILNNNVPRGINRSISVQTLTNQSVLIANNVIFNSIYMLQPVGIIFYGNVIEGDDMSPTNCSLIYSSDCTFVDVPPTHPYFEEIEALFAGGYTNGCSTDPRKYCPDMNLNRAQVAKFFMTVNFGGTYLPPVSIPLLFTDNWKINPWAETWANDMLEKGLTNGCRSIPLLYCPDKQVLREQVAKFALAIRYGSEYVPPAATGNVFADMTDVNYWAIAWVEQAYTEGLIPACGTDVSSGKPIFCPDDNVDRGLGAFVIANAKNLVP